jgi:hypothetical protein
MPRTFTVNNRKLKKIFKTHLANYSNGIKAEIASRYQGQFLFVGLSRAEGFPVCLKGENYVSVPVSLHNYQGRRTGVC